MSEIKISKRYAKAFFDFAVEEKTLDAVYADMELISSTCNASRELMLLLKNPVIQNRKKMSILKQIFESNISPVSIQFLAIVSNGGREILIPNITEQFVNLYKEASGIKTAYIKSATKLDQETKQKITGLLEEQSKSKIELHESVDESLIGGFILNMDNKEFDNSLRNKLKRLQKDFSSNLFIKQI